MNLIEAIKSGKRFGREAWGTKPLILIRKGMEMLNLHVGDIIADDWEIEEEKIEITRSQLEEAWNRTAEKTSIIFKKELGFKDD